MSRHFAVLGKAAPQISLASRPGIPLAAPISPVGPVVSSGEYAELILHLFNSPTVVALVGSHSIPGSGSGTRTEGLSSIAGNLAAELATSGKRVIVVSVNLLFGMNPITIPQETDFIPGHTPNTWAWPPPIGQRIERLRSRETASPGTWLDSLRRNFDSVLLDCPNVEETPGITEVAVMADAAILIAEAGRTSKQQIQQDQRALQLRGAKVVGSILVQQR